MSALQPPPSILSQLFGLAVFQWFHDTWNKLKTLQTQTNSAIYISGLKFTNGSPDGGDIAWTACIVSVNGADYSISAGNTTGGAMLVWWTVGDASFSSGNAYTPSPTTYGIATNTLGVADTTWDKVGANSIQDSQVLGGVFPGAAPQNPSDVAVSGAGNSTTLLSYTGAGGIFSVGITDTGGQSSCANSPGVQLSLTFDGGTPQVYTIKAAAAGPPTNAPWTSEALNSADGGVTGTGNAANDRIIIGFGTGFKTSVLIQMLTPGGVTGTGFYCTVNWAKKL